MFLFAVLPALVFGMESDDFKTVVTTVGGLVLFYMQIRSNQKSDAAKTQAEITRVVIEHKVDTLASNVDGKMHQLLEATASAAKQEGKEEGRQETSGKSEDLRAVVTDAMVDAAPKAAEVAAPVLAKALKDELKGEATKPPDDPTGATSGS